MSLNEVHLQNLIDNEKLTAVISHEIGHVLGIGTLWTDTDPFDQYEDGPWNQYGAGNLVENLFEYVGPNAVEAYSELTGSAEYFVPIENGDSAPGDGSVGVHWSEKVLSSELMTPIADGDLHLSEITIGAIEDLGYVVSDSDDEVTASLVQLETAAHFAEEKNLQFFHGVELSSSLDSDPAGVLSSLVDSSQQELFSDDLLVNFTNSSSDSSELSSVSSVIDSATLSSIATQPVASNPSGLSDEPSFVEISRHLISSSVVLTTVSNTI